MNASTRIRRVVLGIDFSAPSLATARWVARHVAPDAELLLVHVIPVAALPFSHDGVPASHRLVPELRGVLSPALQALADSMAGPRAVAEVRTGEPSAQLAAAAIEFQADLIAVSRTSRRAEMPMGREVGTTADRLVRRAETPVLLGVRAPDAPPRRILAAIDEAEVGMRILSWSATLARTVGAELTALHVVPDTLGAYLTVLGSVSSVSSEALAHGEARAAELRDAAHGWLCERLRRAGVPLAGVEVATAVGDPRHEVLAAAACFDADLAVIGRQGAHATERRGLGSVARAMLRPTGRPVLVVPPGSTALRPPEPLPRRRHARVLRLPGQHPYRVA